MSLFIWVFGLVYGLDWIGLGWLDGLDRTGFDLILPRWLGLGGMGSGCLSLSTGSFLVHALGSGVELVSMDWILQ